MRIVTFKDMLTEPVGTVFYCRDSACAGDLRGPYRKSCPNDLDIFFANCGPQWIMGGTGWSSVDQYLISGVSEREGMFDAYATYLVLDDADVGLMIQNLRASLGDAESMVPCPEEV